MRRTISAVLITLVCAASANAQTAPALGPATSGAANLGCEIAATPLQEPIVVNGVSYANRKVRHLAIMTDVADAGRRLALRVRVINLPPGHEMNEGVVMFVGEPRRVCEGAGHQYAPLPDAPPNFGCAPAGGAFRWLWVAPLQTEPHFMIWHGTCADGLCIDGLRAGFSCSVTNDCVMPVNVFHSILVPHSTSGAAATFEGFTILEGCDPADEGSYSDPLVVTLSRWGDVLRDNATNPPMPPDDIVTISDVVGILNKFKNLVGAPVKARADIEPACPDHRVQISDVTRALDAFAAKPYPFPPGDPAAVCP